MLMIDTGVVFAAFLLTAVAAAGSLPPEDVVPASAAAKAADHNACGVNSLFAACVYTGIDIEFDAVEELVQPSADGTSSLADLQRAAEEAGFHPVAAHLTVSDLEAIPYPAIAHMRTRGVDSAGSHFVLFLDNTAQGMLLLDVPSMPALRDHDWLGAHWTGDTLLLTQSDAAAESVRKQLAGRSWPERVLDYSPVMTVVVALALLMQWRRNSSAVSGSE